MTTGVFCTLLIKRERIKELISDLFDTAFVSSMSMHSALTIISEVCAMPYTLAKTHQKRKPV